MSEEENTIDHHGSKHFTDSKYDIFCSECGRFYVKGGILFTSIALLTVVSYYFLFSWGNLSCFMYILTLFLFYAFSVLRKDDFAKINFALIFLPILILLTFKYLNISIFSDEILGYVLLTTVVIQIIGILRFFIWGIEDGMAFFEKTDPSRNASLILIIVLIVSLGINLIEVEINLIDSLVQDTSLNHVLRKVRTVVGFIAEYKWRFTYGLFTLVIVFSIGLGLAKEVKSISLEEKRIRDKMNKNNASKQDYSFMEIYQIPKFFLFWLTQILGFILSMIVKLFRDSIIRTYFILIRLVIYLLVATISYFMFFRITNLSQTIGDISSQADFWPSIEMIKDLVLNFSLLVGLSFLILLIAILDIKDNSNNPILRLDSEVFKRISSFLRFIGNQLVDKTKGLILNLLKFTILIQLSALSGWLLINLSALFLNTNSKLGMIFTFTVAIFLLLGLVGLIFGKRFSRTEN